MNPQPVTEVPPQCEELWFDDGSVIIRSPSLMFRVYKGILSAHSQVFRDMFSEPQPPDGEDMDGIPVVDISDDSDDVKHFLRALNDVG